MISTNGASPFGVRETMMVWDSGAIRTLLLWAELDIYRCTMCDAEGNKTLHYFSEKQFDKNSHLGGTAHVMIDHVLLTESITDNHETWGVKLEFATT
jgi:peptide subunit release factor 1 (eRF1)